MKVLIIYISFLVLLLIPTLCFCQNIKQGDFSADQTSEGWTLDRGMGTRTQIVFVRFEKEFETTPQVLVSLMGYEAFPDTSGAVRISTRAENVSPSGFVIKVWTWGSSRVNSVTGSWIAFGR